MCYEKDYKKLNNQIYISDYTLCELNKRIDNQHSTYESVIRSIMDRL